MKEKWLKFYNSDWFIYTIMIITWLVASVCLYAFMGHFHLWLAVFLLVLLYIFVKIVTFILEAIFH